MLLIVIILECDNAAFGLFLQCKITFIFVFVCMWQIYEIVFKVPNLNTGIYRCYMQITV